MVGIVPYNYLPREWYHLPYIMVWYGTIPENNVARAWQAPAAGRASIMFYSLCLKFFFADDSSNQLEKLVKSLCHHNQCLKPQKNKNA